MRVQPCSCTGFSSYFKMCPGYILSLNVIFTSCVLVWTGVEPLEDKIGTSKTNDTVTDKNSNELDLATRSDSLIESVDNNSSTLGNDDVQFNATDLEQKKSPSTGKNNISDIGPNNVSDTRRQNEPNTKSTNVTDTRRNSASDSRETSVLEGIEFNATNRALAANRSIVIGFNENNKLVRNNSFVTEQDISRNSTGNNEITNVNIATPATTRTVGNDIYASDYDHYNHSTKQKLDATTKRLQHTITSVSVAPDFKKKTTHRLIAKLPFHVPYMIHGESAKTKDFFLENSKRATLQHHLQLVPMEDEPLGAVMAQDQRYVISVLVPIAIGVFGAALIAGTVFSLRYVARRRAMETPIDDEFDTERDHEACIPSISGETTDKMFLLIGDEE